MTYPTWKSTRGGLYHETEEGWTDRRSGKHIPDFYVYRERVGEWYCKARFAATVSGPFRTSKEAKADVKNWKGVGE